MCLQSQVSLFFCRCHSNDFLSPLFSVLYVCYVCCVCAFKAKPFPGTLKNNFMTLHNSKLRCMAIELPVCLLSAQNTHKFFKRL